MEIQGNYADPQAPPFRKERDEEHTPGKIFLSLTTRNLISHTRPLSKILPHSGTKAS